MAVPTQLSDLSATAASNSPAGSDTVGTTMDDYLRAHASIIARISAGTDALATPALGNATATSVLSNSAALSGYTTGAGGTVVQATSKSTAVTLNKPCGKITTHAENLAAGAVVGFTVNNSLVTADDVIVLTPKDGNGYKYRFSVYSVNNGSFVIAVKNDTAGDLAEALPLNFAVIAASES